MRAPAGLQVFLDQAQNAERVRVPGLELDMRDEPPREIMRALVEGPHRHHVVAQVIEGPPAVARGDGSKLTHHHCRRVHAPNVTQTCWRRSGYGLHDLRLESD